MITIDHIFHVEVYSTPSGVLQKMLDQLEGESLQLAQLNPELIESGIFVGSDSQAQEMLQDLWRKK